VNAIASAGLYNLTVANPGGEVSNAFVVEVLPVLSAITPSQVPAGTAATVTATGLGFNSNCSIGAVGFGTLTSTLVNSTTLTVLVFPCSDRHSRASGSVICRVLRDQFPDDPADRGTQPSIAS